jgi:membrane-bound lytic murein transglycosylase F
MDILFNIAAMFAVMAGTLAMVAGAYYLFDQHGFPRLDFSEELRKGNTAIAIFLAAIVLGMFLLASRATASPLDRYDASFQTHARMQFGYLYPWQTFKAQGMTESNLDPGVCSQVGACGLMQFMPGTAVAMGLQDRFDARESIRAGIAYDRQLWRQWSAPRPSADRLAFALASYNAGLGNVLDFQAAAARIHGAAAANLWAAVAPFAWREPREYIERIERWRERFTRRL